MNTVRLPQKHTLTTGSITMGLITFVIPLMVGSLIQQLYSTVDAIIVGQFTGMHGLAAIDSVHTLFRFPLNFMNGLAVGANILISRSFGANDQTSMHKHIRTALTVSLCLGILCSMIGVIWMPQFLHLMRVPHDIFTDTLLYSRIYFAGIWAMVLYNMLAGILRAFGDSKNPLKILIVCSLLNIVGDYVFVGIYAWGVAGAALATGIAQIISVICAAILLQRSSYITDRHNICKPLFTRAYAWQLIRLGMPLALQSILFPIANSIMQSAINSMGTTIIAAYGVCGKIDLFIWLIADTMGPALTTYTAQNIGANHHNRVQNGIRIGILLSAGTVAFISLILYVFSGTIGSWFIASEDVQAVIPLVIRYMHMMAPFYFFYAIAEGLSGACCGTGDTVRPMITTLVTICLFRILSIWIILPMFQTMECIIMIFIASWIISCIAFILLYHHTYKQRIHAIT